MLGGSSGVNLNFWTHASQKDLDDWSTLGNCGWSWSRLFPYFAKSEAYSSFPTTSPKVAIPQQQAFASAHPLQNENAEPDLAGYIHPSLHGTHGPIKNVVPNFYTSFADAWSPTFHNLGINLSGDPKDGLALGPYNNLVTMDPRRASRSYAATAYYPPSVAARPNLKVLTGALVTKILFADSASKTSGLLATGLRFTINGNSYTAHASHEVILSAGTFQSPQLLELSGIGGRSVLESQGIKLLYENPHVGENLQDHLLIPLGFEAKPGQFTTEEFRDPAAFIAALEKYTKNHTGPLATGGPSALISLKQILDVTPNSFMNLTTLPLKFPSSSNPKSLTEKQHVLSLGSLLSPKEASAQFLFLPGGESPTQASNSTLLFSTDSKTSPGKYLTLYGVLEHPFSRGCVHITSPSPQNAPAINPAYLAHPLDLDLAAQIALMMQHLAQTPPLSNLLVDGGRRLQPGYNPLTTKNVKGEVRRTFSSEYHPIGTCAMHPSEKEGGVVDANLRVYGTKNVRVVDASVFPLLVRANIQTLVYAVAEKAADLIKEDYK